MARINIFQFEVITILHRLQVIINIVEFTENELLFLYHLIIIPVSKYYRFYDKNTSLVATNARPAII